MKVSATRGRLIVFFLALCGLGILVIGGLLVAFFDDIVRIFMKKELVLKPGSEFFNIWQEIPLPIYQKIYIFNITNPYEYEHEGQKPIVQELGPYVFKGHWYKKNINWDDETGEVTYKDMKDYTFVPELSVGDQEEKIYTLNGPLLAVINYVEDFSLGFLHSFAVDAMNGIFESYNSTLLIHRTVRELVYEGYHEPMVADLIRVVEAFVDLPLKLINDTFGILHERKHIGDGHFTIKSGVLGLDDYGSITKWNNQSSVNWWDEDECNNVAGGTDGVQFAPGVNKSETLGIFNPNFCRTITLEYEKDNTVHGIKTLRFRPPEDTFATGEENPENMCYCSGPECRTGILPMNCKPGAPYVLSFPHFYDGEEELIHEVDGLEPPNEDHRTYIDVEPVTGFVLNAAFRMQLNGLVRRLPEYKALESVSAGIVPVLWLSEEAQLDVFFANYFKSRVQTPLVIFRVASLTCVALGAFWTVASIVFLLCIQAKVKQDGLKHNFMLKTLNSVYTSVALWPPVEEETKEANINEKTHL